MKKLGVILLTLAVMMIAGIAAAATANPPTGAAGYTPVVIPIMGVYSGTRNGVVSFKAPAGFKVIHASAVARGTSGTNPTLKIRGKNAGFVNYSGTVASGSTVTDLKSAINASFTDEALQSIDMVIGGTSPKWSDITLFLFLKRK